MINTKRTILITLLIIALLPLCAYCADKGNPPVAQWRFDEGGGPTAYDESTNNNDGTLSAGGSGTNTTVGQMWTRQGKIGGALECDGTDDYVSCGDISSIDGATALTITAWVKFNNNTSDHDICTKGLHSTNQPLVFWRDESVGGGAQNGNTNALSVLLYDGDTQAWSSSPSESLNDTDWHFAAFTFTANTADGLKPYVDGVNVNSASTVNVNSIQANANSFIIGAATSGSVYCNGFIDDVRVYNYVRTPEQMLVDYNAGLASHTGSGIDPNEGNPPVGYWKFDENTGATTYDRSGNGNNGTITGASWAQGKYGGALSFDGTDDYVTTSNSLVFAANAPITLSAWFNTNTLTIDGAYYRRLLVFTNNTGICLSTNQIGMYQAGADIITKSPAFSANSWHQVVAVYNGTTHLLYFDGILADSNVSGSLAINSPAWIGRFNGSNNGRWNGLIDDVKIYNYARTSAQIAYDYNKGKPIAHYKFDEGGGSIVRNESSTADSGTVPIAWWRMDNNWNDSSGYGNNGTAVNQAAFSTSSKIGPYCGTFDGTDDYAEAPSNTMFDSLIGRTFTYSAWVKANDYAPQQIIMARRHPTNNNGHFTIYVLNNKVYLAFYNNLAPVTNAYISSTNAVLTNGQWYHIVWVRTFGQTGTKLYVNGVSQAISSDTAGGGTDYANLKITLGTGLEGASGGSPTYVFNGVVDDVRIYNYARTAEQIYNDYKTTHGTLVGDTKFVDGKIGKALDMDGTGDYVSIPFSDVVNMKGDFTLESWVYPKSIGANKQRIIDTAIDGSTTGQQYSLKCGTTSPYTDISGFVVKSGTSYETKSNTGYITQNQWQHLAYAYDATSGQGTIYHNGKEVSYAVRSTVPGGGLDSLTQGVNIGLLHYTGGSYLYGDQKVDDVRIYNYARTQEQVLQDYNAGLSSYVSAPSAGTADPWGGALPVAHWKMDENTGVLANDASGNGNTGTLGGDGAGTDVPTWAQGKNGPCLSFDGTADYVSLPNTFVFTTAQSFSIEAWFKTSFDFSTRDSGNIYNDYYNNQSDFIGLGVSSTGNYGNLSFRDTAGNLISVSNGTALNDNTWHHIVGIRDVSTDKAYLYVDGIYQNQTTDTTTGNTGNHLYAPKIGWCALPYGSNNNRFNGLIDDVKIYNYARTQAQIAWDYNKGKPVGYWRFDERASGQAVDTTAGAIKDDMGTNNATASNTTWTYTSGKFARCLSFDGNDYVDCGNGTSVNPTSQITVEAWINWTNFGDRLMVGKTNSYTSNYGFLLREDTPSNTVFFWVGNGAAKAQSPSTAGLNTGVWYHVTGVYDGSYVRLYFNGKEVTPATAFTGAIDYTGTGNLYIGKTSWATGAYGLMDDVRIYNYARTADQIAQDYNQGLAAKIGD